MRLPDPFRSHVCHFQTTMTPYTFHRASGWHPLDLPSDEEAIRNALCNPGTVSVVNEVTGKVVWSEADIIDHQLP